ncbi:hypothetical protein CFE70_000270 [Pyrenophora teres f. teres 0-1]|uniref:Uncharacterized protein n=1 Tax=Pyrenophora teres f. teres (strain 0-1) TaxID=861557 RepID=E3RW06_PYRTT|nr:hypothetical protein PTT_13403 [Pyrenophora teres f. teres 0-1]KAE8840025.1 hypothetical protein HRS9122_06630 [Pyrenophora teres f. teres]
MAPLNDKTLPMNPTRKENWLDEPKNERQFQKWLSETREMLLQWLREAEARARDMEISAQIEENKSQSETVWEQYKGHVDVQTGDIYDKTAQKAMQYAMGNQEKLREKLHKRLGTYHRFIEYRTAQATWEDFLYYQNVWNRRSPWAKQVYHETPADRPRKEHSRASRAALRAASKNERDPFGPVGGDTPATPLGTSIKKKHAAHLLFGTPGYRRISRRDDAPHADAAYFGAYYEWRERMSKTYEKFKLGYRKRIPAVVGPEDAHRYSQPTRGTTPSELLRYRRRHRHLEERFPREKRRKIDPTEVEEGYRSKEDRAKDLVLKGQGKMEAIVLTLDEETCNTKRKEKDSKYMQNPGTQRLLPKDHVLHHGCLETSFDWPTSFSSPDMIERTMITKMKRAYVYEETGDTELNGGSLLKRRSPIQYKLDEQGQRIKRIDREPRYQVSFLRKRGQVFIHDMHPDGSVVGRDRNGKWFGHGEEGDIEELNFDLEGQGERIAEANRYLTRNIFTTSLRRARETPPTRSEVHHARNITNQLSDAEDENCVNGNPNWLRSANLNPDQLGNINGSETGSETVNLNTGQLGNINSSETGRETTNGGSDSDDTEDSDDEGDCFAESYREFSKHPTRKSRS